MSNIKWWFDMMQEEQEFYDKFPVLAQLTINYIAKALRESRN